MADEAFKKPVNGRVGAEVDPEAGGHEVIIRGYREDGDFWMVNSWGTGWGLGGCAWIDPSRIAGSPSVVIAKGVS
jgi:hypothetical protein